MLASNIPVITKPCSSCGAYGGSQRQSSCQPGRRIKHGRFRHAARDARRSALILENRRIQDSMIAGLVDADPSNDKVCASART
jgi:hypothetical protein